MFITSFDRQNFLFVFAATDKSQAMIQKKLWGLRMTKQDLDFYENHKKRLISLDITAVVLI